MKIIHGVRPNLLPASVVTLGMFDGVHRGHQALLASCRRHADRLGLPAVALTYEPHPVKVLRPGTPVRLLTLLPEKLDGLARYGMDDVVIAEFTRAFSLISAETFLCDVLLAALHPQVIVVGYRTTFGHERAGTAKLLRTLGNSLGFAVEVVEPVEVDGAPVSSSHIRQCLDKGDVSLAAELLGYRYQLTGIVSTGDRRGGQLGIPTANLEVSNDKMLPADGVYVVDACAPGLKRRAVMNIGSRPTFDRPRALEVHLLDFSGDLYHQPLTVTFLARLREVCAFSTSEELISQIQRDIQLARRWEEGRGSFKEAQRLGDITGSD